MATVNKDFRVKNNISIANTADTTTNASHYIVETGSDGVIRPKTLANTRAEIVTTAAVNDAAATTVGTITSGVWQGSSISTTYTDAKVTSVNGSTGAVTGLATTAGKLSQFAATTSAELAGIISDETGSGVLVFGTSPAITTSITTPSTSFDLINATATTINFAGAATTLNIGGASTRLKLTAGSILEAPISTNVETASYSLILSDAGQLIEMNVATANNLTVPLNSTVAFPIGTKIDILQTGAGQTTIVATPGVTINSNSTLKLSGQWAAATLIKRAENTWVLIGSLE